MRRSFSAMLILVVLAPLTFAQDAMQKKVDSMKTTLGTSTGQERRVAGGGRVREFEKGAIYWSKKTGARFVGGGALEKYRELGAESGSLGYPVTDERTTSDGLVQTFEHGLITTTSTGEVEVTLLPGVTLTEDSLMVSGSSPVRLELDDIGGLIIRDPESSLNFTALDCTCFEDPGPISQRAGFCRVKISDRRRKATCLPDEGNPCRGFCAFTGR